MHEQQIERAYGNMRYWATWRQVLVYKHASRRARRRLSRAILRQEIAEAV